MNQRQLNASWLLTESLRIGAIVLLGFLLAHVFTLFVEAFAIELLYGIEGTLVAVVQNTALITAFLYAIAKGVNDPGSSTAVGDD